MIRADATVESYVSNISYNARNQREEIQYGNGVLTRYTYERETFLLKTLRTIRLSDQKLLQDLAYTYDPVQNITRIRDLSHVRIFHGNQAVDPVQDFTYDALYRLVQAKGREHPALYPNNQNLPDYAQFLQTIFSSNNGQHLQNYTRLYRYDDAGNLIRTRHQGARSFTRNLTIAPTSNRAILTEELSKTTLADSYDANGNLEKLSHLRAIHWNYRDNIARVDLIQRQNAISDSEYYVYDHEGQRIRKVAEFLENGGQQIRIEEKIYIGEFEIKRTRMLDGPVHQEQQSIHVMDDLRRIAISLQHLIGKKTAEPERQQRFQFGNHLGSASLVLDGKGQIITYEEYFPYGGCALIAGKSQREVSEKVYRYSGKERDTHTGLYYYGARYYPPWMGRWLNPDPAGIVDGLNVFAFVGGNPISRIDLNGNDWWEFLARGLSSLFGSNQEQAPTPERRRERPRRARQERRQHPKEQARGTGIENRRKAAIAASSAARKNAHDEKRRQIRRRELTKYEKANWQWVADLNIEVATPSGNTSVPPHLVHSDSNRQYVATNDQIFLGSYTIVNNDGSTTAGPIKKFTPGDLHTEPQYFRWLDGQLATENLSNATAIIMEINQTNTPCSLDSCRFEIMSRLQGSAANDGGPFWIARMGAHQMYSQAPAVPLTSFSADDIRRRGDRRTGDSAGVVSSPMAIHKVPDTTTNR